jgi:hypothetical protein
MSRERNLRWMAWLRLGSATAGLALAHGAPQLAAVPIAAGFVALNYRSAWYRSTGWFALGSYDFVMVLLGSRWPIGLPLCGIMILLSGLLLYRPAIAGAVVLGTTTAIVLLVRGGRSDLIPVACGAGLLCGAAALLADRAYRRRPRTSISLR